MATSEAKSAVAKARQRKPDGTYVKGAPRVVSKNAMPRSGDNTRTGDHVSGDPWIANPHDIMVKAAPPGLVPAAPGVWHANIFRMISQQPSQIFRNLDEALRANRISAKAMLNDGAIVAPLFQRILHLVSCNDGLVPEDENDQEQIEACEKLWNLIQRIPDWAEFKRTLAEAIWYGKCVNKVDYRWQYIKGERCLVPVGFTNIIGDKLVFRTNGQMGYIVHYPSGLRDVVVTDIGRAELFNDDDYEALVHHKYFQVDVPYDEGMLAIGQEGFGYRNYLYYLWWLKQSLLEWAMLGLQIFGNGGLRIAYFEEGNPDSQTAVANAMAEANGQNIILFPRPIGDEKQGAGVEIISPSGLGLDWFKNFLSDYFGAQIDQLFLGKDYDGERKDLFAYLRYDAQKLSSTITRDFVSVMQKYNMPEYTHEIKYEISVPHPNSEQVMTAAQRLFELGCPVGAREVASLVGLTIPGKGRRILQKSEAEMLGGVAGMQSQGAVQTIKQPRLGAGTMSDQLTGGTGIEHSLQARANEAKAEEHEAAVA
jgi:hypothetical protein